MHSDLSFPVKKLFIDDTPTAKLVRQVLGAISEFDKAMTVAKLRGARERKRREAGKCEGRKTSAEISRSDRCPPFGRRRRRDFGSPLKPTPRQNLPCGVAVQNPLKLSHYVTKGM